MRVLRNIFVSAPTEAAARVQAYIDTRRDLAYRVIDDRARTINAFGRCSIGLDQTLFTQDIPQSALARFMGALKKRGAICSVTETIEYSIDDVLAAPACMIRSRRRPVGGIPEHPSDAHARIFDTASGCKQCWTGARQIGDLVLKGFSPRKQEHICETLSGFFLVHKSLRTALARRLPRSCFRPVRSTTAIIPDWFQLVPEVTLPKLHRKTIGLTTEGQCRLCRQDGFYGTREHEQVPKYSRVDLGSITLAATWERFGVSNRHATGIMVQRVAQPNLCVGRRVAEKLIGLHNKAISLVPVHTVK